MAFKLPKLNIKGTNIKESMDRKYGTGEYSRGGKKFEHRMKPGESKFQYNVRMRKTETPRSKEKGVEVDWDNFLGNEPTSNPNDKRKKVDRFRDEGMGRYFTFSGELGDEFKYRYLDVADEDLPLQERFEFQRAGSDVWETSKTYKGAEAISDLFIRDDISAEITPIQKRKK